MEANKFEKHIAEKMKEREIQPSPAAWEKINERLESVEAPKKKGYFWYGIAASIVGLLIISIVFFNRDGTTEVPEVVETPEVNEENIFDKEPSTIQSPDEVKITLEIPEEKETKDVELELPIVNEQEVAVNEVENKLNSQTKNLEDEILPVNEVEELAVSDDVVEAKIKEVLAQVDMLEANSTSLTDIEVDSLLRQAQQEIVTEKILGNGGSINAMALLSEVEEELDQSFRDQIFDKLKSGFLKVRTAVADRNN